MEEGPATLEMIEAELARKFGGPDADESFRVGEWLRHLEREGRIATARGGATRLYMLTEAGLEELAGADTEGGVVSAVLSEFVKSAESRPDPDRLP